MKNQKKLQKQEDNIKYKLFIKENTVACPECKTPIEKSEGCNHMECVIC